MAATGSAVVSSQSYESCAAVTCVTKHTGSLSAPFGRILDKIAASVKNAVHNH